MKSSNLSIHYLRPGGDYAILYLARGVTDFLILIFASWIMGRIENKTIADYGLPWRKMFRAQFWQGALLGFAMITCLLLIQWIAGAFSFGEIALHGVTIFSWAAGYALVFSLVALLEEFGTRGYALYTLSGSIGFWPTATLSALVFVYLHRGNSGESWVGLFNLGLFALLACFLLRRTGNLWMPIGFHMASDWSETYFYGVANSGVVYPGRLLHSNALSPAWLSGGSAGPEGSAIYSLLIIAVWISIGIWSRRIKRVHMGETSA